MRLKIGVAILITAINISVYNIQIPARLQISPEYEQINLIWDRCEKAIYLLADGCLNWFFIRTVRERLVRKGMVKYDRLTRSNMWIIGFSLSMDCLTIGTTSLNNSFVQIHLLFSSGSVTVERNEGLVWTIDTCNSTHLLTSLNSISRCRWRNLWPKFLPAATTRPSLASTTYPNHLKRMNSLTRYPGNRPDDWSGSLSSFDVDRSRTSPHGGEMMVNMKREVHVQVERLAASFKRAEVDCGEYVDF